ncbi:hypothetical protein ABZ512_08795 [Nocardiopsis dassonvillei]|uniref:hypothetical protein n=1 Tax=Nocardiopsis dassonvillei TaxID=2014 RepID=UPI0033D8FCE4
MLADIDKKLAHDTENLSTQIHDEEGTELSVQDIRDRLTDPDFPSSQKNQYLRALVHRSQTSGDAWQSAVTHVMIPSLRRLARKLSRYGRTEADEADSEVLTSFIETISTVDPETEDLETHLHRATSRAASKSLQQLRRDSPVEDIELVGALRADQDPTEVITEAVLQKKDADRRTVPSHQHQVEGERWGAMLHRMGIHEKIRTSSGNNAGTRGIPYAERPAKPHTISMRHTEAEAKIHNPKTPKNNEKEPAVEASPVADTRRQRRTNNSTVAEVLGFPAVVSLQKAANAMGISISTAYKLVHQDRFPCTVLRPGHRYKIPTAGLMKCLQIENHLVYMEDVDQGASFAREEG